MLCDNVRRGEREEEKEGSSFSRRKWPQKTLHKQPSTNCTQTQGLNTDISGRCACQVCHSESIMATALELLLGYCVGSKVSCFPRNSGEFRESVL